MTKQVVRHCGFHRFLREFVVEFVGGTEASSDAMADECLRRIGEHFEVDRVMIAPVARSGAIRAPIRVWVSNDWTSHGLTDGVGLPPMPQCAAHLARERALVFNRLDDLRDWPEEREALRRLGVGASAVAILGDAGSHLVAVGLDSLRTELDWPEDIVSDLRILGALVLSVRHRAEIDAEIEGIRGFAQVISRFSSRFINLPAEQVDAEVENALRRVCEHLDVDLATMSQWTDSWRVNWTVSHEWGSDAAAGIRFRGTVIAAEYPWLSARLKEAAPLVVSSLDDLPAEATAERAACEQIGIQSMLWVPYEVEGVIAGHVVLNTIRCQRSWSDRLISQLQLAGQVLASAIARQRADVELNRAHLEIRSLKARLEAENLSLREEVQGASENGEFVGRSALLQDILQQVKQVASTDSTVLLLGETGTGKGLAAREIHASSQRANRSLITVNCAALPALLIESELFGHERGAFTGAVTRKIGRFELATEGTLLLDEIGDLPLELQAKLLRVLHDREFERLGSTKTITTDARIIAATNRNLEALMERGSFREDLYHRLHVFPIRMPALREHPEDIPLLVWYFLGKLQGRLGRRIETVSSVTMEKLKTYDWPGNIRELQNVLERAVILSPSSTLELGNIRLAEKAVEHAQLAGRDTRTESLQDVERDHIIQMLQDCEWKIRGADGAAERLGLKRTTLNSKMKKLGIRRPSVS